MKVVINVCFGGFGLSRAAFLRLREMGNAAAKEEPDFGEKYSDGSGPRQMWGDGSHQSFLGQIDRADKQLIQVVEEMGDAANGGCAKLKVVEIPDGIKWGIHEYDGTEHVEEEHRTWS